MRQASLRLYIPDPCRGAEGKLVTLTRRDLSTSPTQRYVLVDIGIRGAVNGFSLFDYLKLVEKAKALPHVEEVAAVVPDVFNDFAATVRNYKKYAPRMRGVKLVFVAQQLVPPPGDLEPPPDIVAVPAHKQGNVSCSRNPRLCAERASRFLQIVASSRVHFLGPPKRLLRLLLPLLGDGRTYSADTMAYRLAPAQSAKLRRKEGDRGLYMADKSVVCKWFELWARL